MKDWADKATLAGRIEDQWARIYSPTTMTDLLFYPTVDNRKSLVSGNKLQPACSC